MGFQILPIADQGFKDRIRKVFPVTMQANPSNIAWRSQGELLVYLFDVSLRRQGTSHGRSVETGNVGLVSPRLNLPSFLLVGKPIEFEKIGVVFSDYNVMQPKADITYEVVTDRVKQALDLY